MERLCKLSNGTVRGAWTATELTRAVQLMDGGLCYACIAKLLYLDGLSPHLRTRGAVRSRLRDVVEEMPKRRRGQAGKGAIK